MADRKAACERLPFAEGFLKYAPAPNQPAECQRQLERLAAVWTLEYRQGLECLKWAKTYQSFERPDFVTWYLLGVRMFYFTAPKAYHSVGRARKKSKAHTYEVPLTGSDRLTWPWWQLDDEELLLEAPTALPRDALLALVLMDEVRKAEGNVGEDFLSFLRESVSSWHSELLAKVFDIDAMTELLSFLLDPLTDEEGSAASPGIYLTEFLCTLENLIDRGVMEVAVGTEETLKPFAAYYASRGEPDFTADRIKVYAAEPDELHERQVVPMFNMVALVEHVDFLQANCAAKVALAAILQCCAVQRQS